MSAVLCVSHWRGRPTRCQLIGFSKIGSLQGRKVSPYWVAVKELNLSYYIGETL